MIAGEPAEVVASAGVPVPPPLDVAGMTDRELLESAAIDARQALAIATALGNTVNQLAPIAEGLAAGGPMAMLKLLGGR